MKTIIFILALTFCQAQEKEINKGVQEKIDAARDYYSVSLFENAKRILVEQLRTDEGKEHEDEIRFHLGVASWYQSKHYLLSDSDRATAYERDAVSQWRIVIKEFPLSERTKELNRYFQTIDDKSHCIGIYTEGKLYYEDFPALLTKTWKYSASLEKADIEYAWLRCNGLSLNEVCPAELQGALLKTQKRLRAYMKSFQLAKIDMHDHCIFDLVPEDFLKQFCEIKNKITEHVFETYEKPACYEHLHDIQKLLYKIRYQKLNLNNDGCKNLHFSSRNSTRVKALLRGPRYIDYNPFGTVTGRLTTSSESFPILTVQKDFRKLLKPHHDWFLSLDYNAAEVRTFIGLVGEEQPPEDVHQWHIKNLIRGEIEREDAKIKFFAWLYNPEAPSAEFNMYRREKVLDKWYKNGYINTIFNRKIRVDVRKALNYLVQSTTSDLVMERAVVLDRFLSDKKSFISHIVHDEIVIDLADEERVLVPEIKEIFANNKLDRFLVNLTCGKNYYDLRELSL